ncbi:MAG: capsular biosynthesis protein [Methylophilaceae bacterium]|nr:capsular biosynthesis protein [Methylophilaceae bacterium]
MKRSFLFLQGPATPFFHRLAQRLRAAGHAVHRVHFCAGDVLYGGLNGARCFRAPLSALVPFLDELYRRHGITDQIVFGDRRPVHRPALAHGEACGVRSHVFEEGYFRPYWVTLEREGVNGHSLLPRDPDWFWEVGGRLAEPTPPVAFDSPFYKRAVHDVAYHVAGMFNPLLFPRYRTHAGVTAPVEYAGYVKRFAWLRLFGARERKRALAIAQSGRPYYVLPLQLNTDAQIRDHSRFAHMGEVIEYVMESFARHAPTDAMLVIKNHPLDQGLMPYAQIIRACARRLDVRERVEYLEDGDLVALFARARGVVTVNSTAGILALQQGIPTYTLSDPIYNLPGLTGQMPLDAFWREATPPNQELFTRFRRCVIHTTQINGGFYCARGIALAVEHAVQVLTAEQSPLEKLL